MIAISKAGSMDLILAKKLYEGNGPFKDSIDYFAERDRRIRNGVFRVKNLRFELRKRGILHSIEELVTVLENLEKCGWGEFVKGRPKQDSRIVVGSRDVSDLAREIIEETNLCQGEVVVEEQRRSDEFEIHSCPVRPGVFQELRLRTDLTQRELENLADFVRIVAASRARTEASSSE